MIIREMLKIVNEDSDPNVNQGTQEAKNLFKSNNRPFSLKDGVEGENTVVVFTEHFLMVFRDADSNECMAKMSLIEKYLYWDYIRYQGLVAAIMLANPTWTDEQVDTEAKIQYEAGEIKIAPELVVRTLGDWASAEVQKFDKDSCYSTMHKWDD